MLSQEDQNQLLDLAEESIEHGLERGTALKVDPSRFPESLQSQQACFVTLNKEGQLRGCIGHLEASQTIVEEVSENAFNAAFKDPRFPKLKPQEMPKLEIHISLLTIPEPLPVSSEADLLSKLQPGIDGIILKVGFRQATFLPSVWEQLPDPAQFLHHLKLKGQFSGQGWNDNMEVFRYRTESIER